MAARKRSATRPGTMPQQWRDRIQASMLVNRLTDHVKGDVELTPSQVTAGLGLLKKAIPDLAALQVTGDPENPVHIQSKLDASGLSVDQLRALASIKV